MCCAKPAGHQPPRPPALFARPPGKPSVDTTKYQQADEEADGPVTNLPDRRHFSHDPSVNRVSPLQVPAGTEEAEKAGHQPPRPPALFALTLGKPSVAATKSQQAPRRPRRPATNLPDRRHSSHGPPVNRVSPLQVPAGTEEAEKAGHQPPRPPALFALTPGKPSVAASKSQQAEEAEGRPACAPRLRPHECASDVAATGGSTTVLPSRTSRKLGPHPPRASPGGEPSTCGTPRRRLPHGSPRWY